MYLISPKYIEPKKLKNLADRYPDRKLSKGFSPVSFPLKSMEEIFKAYSSGTIDKIRLIDHCRLAMALMANLKTLMEGNTEHYKGLVWEHLRKDKFVKSVFERSQKNKIFAHYLQTIFIMYEDVKEPHYEFMEKFYRVAVIAGKLTPDIKLLVEIRNDKDKFLKKLAHTCLIEAQEPIIYWYYNLELLYDDYVQEFFIDPAEEYLLDNLLRDNLSIGEEKVLTIFSFLLKFYDHSQPNLTKRVEKAILVSENYSNIQKPLLEYLESNLEIPPDWDLLPGINSQAVNRYHKLRGLVEFQYFELIAEFIYEKFLDDADEKNRLKNRTIFWMNYRDEISRIKIFSNSDTLSYLKNNFLTLKKEYRISERLLSQIGTTEIDSEIVLILIKNVLIVEFFRGTGMMKKTCIIQNGKKMFDKMDNISKLRIDDAQNLRNSAAFFVSHDYLWQNAMFNFLEDTLKITFKSNYALISKGKYDELIDGETEFRRFKPLKKQYATNKKSRKIIEKFGTDYSIFLNTIITNT